MLTRREFHRAAVAALPVGLLSAPADSRIRGVPIGVQSYSFRDRSLDEAIAAMREIGLTYCELWQGHLEPRKVPREELRKWRLQTPLSFFEEVREKFRKAGITLCAYSYGFRQDFTDDEIVRGFEMARALGVHLITSSANVSVAKRVDPVAQKTRITVAMHNHSVIKPDEFARPEDFEEAMRGASRYIAINLDIGHFVAAGYDPVSYIEKHQDRIPIIHVKDRKKDQGPNVPFGEGDTPIREVLLLLARKRLATYAMIEYEYKGGDTVQEVRRCYEYCRKALA
ncbi:MAG: sugar phosphate isomerase/epimerase [Bryobacterales bacterium]|nr:sugar phosphate isomerase/epimerase [Bryobacterales bacterium]